MGCCCMRERDKNLLNTPYQKEDMSLNKKNQGQENNASQRHLQETIEDIYGRLDLNYTRQNITYHEQVTQVKVVKKAKFINNKSDDLNSNKEIGDDKSQ